MAFTVKSGPAKVFTTEPAVIEAIKSGGVQAGDILVLMCRGPLGSGMEETYQVTSALKHLPFGKHVAVITDARFSGVSTGACIGHVSPEALAGGPLGKLRDGDLIEIIIDRNTLEGSVDFVGENGRIVGKEEGERVLAARSPRPDLAPDAALPADTRLWAALQDVSGGPWGGCVYDVEAILRVLAAGKRAIAEEGVAPDGMLKKYSWLPDHFDRRSSVAVRRAEVCTTRSSPPLPQKCRNWRNHPARAPLTTCFHGRRCRLSTSAIRCARV